MDQVEVLVRLVLLGPVVIQGHLVHLEAQAALEALELLVQVVRAVMDLFIVETGQLMQLPIL
jgi:hypothetical protein